MNTNENRSTKSASDLDNPCFGHDSTIAALNVFADDEHGYLLPYAQFLYAERTVNPALEREPDAPPETLVIRFAVAKVVVLGAGLKAIEHQLQKYRLQFVKSSDPRYAATLKAHVTAISITFTKEVT
jgi:hypothetical protein